VIFVGPIYHGPFEHDEHYFGGAGFTWIDELSEAVPTGNGLESITSTVSENRGFSAGQHFDERWNQAVFGPVFAGPNKFGVNNDLSSAPVREDGFFALEPSMFTDLSEPARESDESELTAELDDDEADFRLEADYTRPSDQFDLSTHVTAAWSFHSAPDPDGNEIRLALPMMRFAPPLDDHNRTAATVMPLPIKIDRPVGAPTPRIKSATVDVSFDDGATGTRRQSR
jgi:hypothetical protein